MVGGSKHRSKVDECYPKRGKETSAAAGKISALTYYINAKPEKLLKVSTYLLKKVPRDLTKESADYNRVTLEIVEGIMKSCSDYFASFAPSVVKLMLLFGEATLTPHTHAYLHSLYVEFCRMSKTVLPLIRDPEFFEKLTVLQQRLILDSPPENFDRSPYLDTFLATYTGQLCRLIAADIKAAVSMEDFRSPLGGDRIGIIVQGLIRQLRKENAAKLEEATSLLGHGRNRIRDDLDLLYDCLVSLVSSSNSSTISTILTCIFREFDSDGWAHQRLCRAVLSIVIQSVPAQYLCVIISEFFRHLDKAEDNVTAIISESIGYLLESNRGPLGYSALELTGNLLKLLRKQRVQPAGIDPPSSFAKFRVRPPKTVFSICSAFVSLLKNATFALQKYEIIEALIVRAFFANEMINGQARTGILNVPSFQDIDRHSMGTVTLNSDEEGHFRSIVWGILFALAEEGSPPSVLRLAFVEVQVKLFERLFTMASTGDSDFCLNSLVLWRQLLAHGLPIVPNRLSLARDNPTKSQTSMVLGRPSTYILTKTRYILGMLISRFDSISIVHLAVIFLLISEIIPECDLTQLALYSSFAVWIEETCRTKMGSLHGENIICVQIFALRLLRSIGRQLPKEDLFQLASTALQRAAEAEISVLEAGDILDPSNTPIFTTSKLSSLTDPPNLIISHSLLKEKFECSLSDQQKVLVMREQGALEAEYSLELDARNMQIYGPSILGQQTPRSTSFGQDYLLPNVNYARKQSERKSATASFSRLSQQFPGATSHPASIATAPAFYQSSSTAPYAENLTISNESLLNPGSESTPKLSNISNVLESQFDDLEMSQRKRHTQRSGVKSLLLSKPDSH